MRIGLANGCFDLFHEGHQHYLSECRQWCDYLIAAVNDDDSVKRLKGNDRPIDSLQARMRNVRKHADAVIPYNGWDDYLLQSIAPNVLFKGYDHHEKDSFICWRKKGWKSKQGNIFHRCQIINILELPGHSTTKLIQKAHAIPRNAQVSSSGVP